MGFKNNFTIDQCNNDADCNFKSGKGICNKEGGGFGGGGGGFGGGGLRGKGFCLYCSDRADPSCDQITNCQNLLKTACGGRL